MVQEGIVYNPEHGSTLIDEPERDASEGEAMDKIGRSVCIVAQQQYARSVVLLCIAPKIVSHTNWIDTERGLVRERFPLTRRVALFTDATIDMHMMSIAPCKLTPLPWQGSRPTHNLNEGYLDSSSD